MKLSIKSASAAAVLSVTTMGLMVTGPVEAHTTGIHDNCTNLNKKWPHGVGLRNAVDKTSGIRVKNFYKNDDAYRTADRHNGTLDRDNDKIACEKR
jgi:hypothetical protein